MKLLDPIDIYFLKRQIGENPDKTKYYFKNLDQLILGVDIIKDATNSGNHIQWSLQYQSENDDKAAYLMYEFWDKDPHSKLTCKSWVVFGFIIKQKCPHVLHEYLKIPLFEPDYRNRFIPIDKMSEEDKQSLTEDDIKAGGKVMIPEPSWM
jgi:hypothetical protein